MKIEVAGPTRIADVVAEFATAGALRVSTRAIDERGARMAATTLIYLDGDVTTSITRACLEREGAEALLQRHAQELGKLGRLFQLGATRAVRLIAAVSAGLVVLGVALDAGTGHAWWHILATSFAITGAGGAAIGLARRLAIRLVVRSARRAIARRRGAPAGT